MEDEQKGLFLCMCVCVRFPPELCFVADIRHTMHESFVKKRKVSSEKTSGWLWMEGGGYKER